MSLGEACRQVKRGGEETAVLGAQCCVLGSKSEKRGKIKENRKDDANEALRFPSFLFPL
jgi:hypothetical protein